MLRLLESPVINPLVSYISGHSLYPVIGNIVSPIITVVKRKMHVEYQQFWHFTTRGNCQRNEYLTDVILNGMPKHENEDMK